MGQAANILPPTPKQVDYARSISARLKAPIPPESAADRAALSEWIGIHARRLTEQRRTRPVGATSKQVAFAERIARAKRRDVPDECFRDAGLMSRWIDSNR